MERKNFFKAFAVLMLSPDLLSENNKNEDIQKNNLNENEFVLERGPIIRTKPREINMPFIRQEFFGEGRTAYHYGIDMQMGEEFYVMKK